MNQPLETVTITLRPERGNWQNTPERRLARLLKMCLRGYGWRCVNITIESPALIVETKPHDHPATNRREDMSYCPQCSEAAQRIAALEKRCGELEALAGQYKYFTSFTPCFPLNDWFVERDKLHSTQPNTALASMLKPTRELLSRLNAKVMITDHLSIAAELQRLEGICKP